MSTTLTAAPRPTSDSRGDLLMLRRFARSHDPQLRERIVVRYQPLVRYVANAYVRRSESFDDLIQVANVGLLHAVDRYDPERGVSFAGYALPTMHGEVRRYFRDQGWAVRPPRTLQEHALAVERTTAELTNRLGRSPSVPELAAETGLSLEEVLEAREAARARSATSLSAPVGDEEGGAVAFGDLMGAPEPGYERVDARASLDVLMRRLSRRERLIVRMRLEEDLTQSEIGARVGLSQMHISRVLRDALEKLRLAAETAPEIAATRS